MPRVFIGLGTNLGNREENLRKAKEFLNASDFKIIKESSIAETEPVIIPDQPKFLNQVIIIETEIKPEILLKKLKSIEILIGRKKTIPKGPRIIDLDILLYNRHIIEEKKLKIPHPEIKNRKFILDHLAELDPELTDPVTGKKYQE